MQTSSRYLKRKTIHNCDSILWLQWNGSLKWKILVKLLVLVYCVLLRCSTWIRKKEEIFFFFLIFFLKRLKEAFTQKTLSLLDIRISVSSSSENDAKLKRELQKSSKQITNLRISRRDQDCRIIVQKRKKINAPPLES